MYYIHEFDALPQAEKDAAYQQIKAKAVRNFLTFIAIKIALYTAVAYFAKKARELP